MLRVMVRSLGLTAALAALMLVPSCKKDEPPAATEPPADPLRQSAVDRCAAGIERAVARTTYEQAMGTYYRECSDIYTRQACRDAWRTGADNPTAAGPVIADACRKAYCPELTSTPLELCAPDFSVTSPRFDAAWAQFFGVVLEREGGESLTPSLLTLLVRLAALKAQAAALSSAEPPPSASVAPAGSPPPAPSASALATSAPSAAPAKKPPVTTKH